MAKRKKVSGHHHHLQPSASSSSASSSHSARRRRRRAAAGGAGGGEVKGGTLTVKKRIMVVVDGSARAKHAVEWASSHVANEGDIVTLLHVLPPHCAASAQREEEASLLVKSLAAVSRATSPQVRVEALVIEGPKLGTVLGLVKKLEVSVLVLKQPKPSPLCCLFPSGHEEFVEQCISRAECLTMAVQKQTNGVGGYLVSTRWQKNFWLLA